MIVIDDRIGRILKMCSCISYQDIDDDNNNNNNKTTTTTTILLLLIIIMRTFVRRNLNSSEMRRQDANAESYRG